VDPGLTTPFNRSFVRIRGADGAIAGAGFLASARGDVLTCAHVIARALGTDSAAPDVPAGDVSLDLPFVDRRSFTATVARWVPRSGSVAEPSGDIAVLAMAGDVPAAARPARLALGPDLFGRRFRTHGYPAGHDAGVFAYGELRDRLSNGWLQVEDTKAVGRSIEPGFSGGPVEDQESGHVVGMVVASTAEPGDKVAFVIPSDILARAWPALEIGTTAARSQEAAAGVAGSVLTVLDGSGDEVVSSGKTALLRFGRDPSSDVVLDQPASWEHARILLSGGAFVYQHLGRRPAAIRRRTGQLVVLSREDRNEETLRQSDRIELTRSRSVTVRFELTPERAYLPTVCDTSVS
jgi:hypothetical protein